LPDPALAALVPVRIDMRTFALYMRTHGGEESTFFDYLHRELRPYSLDLLRMDRLQKLAEQGRLWWIFDGLDEVVDAEERRRCIAMIGAVKRRYGGRGLITSRDMGSDDMAKSLADFGIPQYALAELDDVRLRRLWDRFPMPDTRRERLLSVIARNPALHELCRVPLVATMVALLSRHRNIPEQRRALYGEIIELLVENWEQSKGAGPDDGALKRFDFKTKISFLMSLAHHMMLDAKGGQGNAIGADDLLAFAIAFCRDKLRETELVARKMAKQLLARLRDRHGVLVYWGANTYGFVHRSFLDALAAEELVDRFCAGIENNEILELTRTGWESRTWRECLVLAVGGIAENRPAEAMKILQQALKSVRMFEADLSTFAAFCIRVLSESGPALETEPLHGFALRLTELIRISGAGYFYEINGEHISDLLLAFREIGARWPGANILRAWALDEVTSIHSFTDSNTSRFAVTTTPLDEHVPFLRELLRRRPAGDDFSFALRESCFWRRWTEAEIWELRSAAQAVSEKTALQATLVFAQHGYDIALDESLMRLRSVPAPLDQMHVAVGLLDEISPNSNVRASRVAALKTILEIVESAPKESMFYNGRMFSRLARIDDPLEQKVLFGKLNDWLVTDSAFERPFAALVLGLRGEEKASAILTTMARSKKEHYAIPAVDALLQLADTYPWARKALQELTDDADALLDMGYSFERLLMGISRMADKKFAGAMLLRLRDSTRDVRLRLSIARKMRGIAELEAQANTVLLEMARPAADAQVRELAVNSLCSYRPHADEATLRELLTMDTAQPFALWQRFDIADTLLRSHIEDPTLRQKGEDILVGLVAPEMPSDVRRTAAYRLRELGYPLGETVLRELAQSADIDEETRRFAARSVLELDVLHELAETATSEQVRKEASKFLDLLAARDALLRVGRLRRAIVSLSGQRVGVLHETPSHGSSFVYDPAWLENPRAKAIGPSMPLRSVPYESDGLLPFFENLLPEGWLLDIARKKLGPAGQDVFGLLLATCRDCIGAVEITPAPDEDDK
ncbi:MAG TPA: HipA N-terminal domain-containing protein, partial [Polyangium sp.]|nr:HipA N-terminal domain-containing protein [Polyangium sp.]